MTLREKVAEVVHWEVVSDIRANEIADAILALLSTADSEQREVLEHCRSGVTSIIARVEELADSPRSLLESLTEDLPFIVKTLEEIDAALTRPAEQQEVVSFCPEDGFNVRVDEDGCCEACGAVATGWAVDRLTRPADSLAQEVVWLLTHNPAHPNTSIKEWHEWERRRDALLARLGKGGPK